MPNKEIESPLCQVNCKTCNSIHLEEIHQLKLEKSYSLREISKYIYDKYGEYISIASLSGHFSHYFDYIKQKTSEKIVEYVEKETDQRAEHTLKINALINKMFDDLAENWKYIPPTIENLKSLFQIQHNLLNGISSVGSEDEQIKKLIEKSSQIDPNQLTLFAPASDKGKTQKTEEENR